jgi:hypothetical protein
MKPFTLRVDAKGGVNVPPRLWKKILELKGIETKNLSVQKRVVKNQIIGALEQMAETGQGRIPNDGPKKNHSRRQKEQG